MRTLRFNARPHHRLEVEPGCVVYGGREFDVPNDVADRLLDDPSVDVTEVAREQDIKSMTRAELNDRATQAGMTDAGAYPTKQALVDAIVALGETPGFDLDVEPVEPEADGEGHDDNPETPEEV